jgi:Cys-rich four helix bundle protein (predicted Tat secretion target)
MAGRSLKAEGRHEDILPQIRGGPAPMLPGACHMGVLADFGALCNPDNLFNLTDRSGVMDRRSMLTGGSALLASAAVVKVALAAEEDPHAHHHHHDAASPAAALAAAASDCVQKGEACIAHCLVLLGDGDKDIAGCAQSVSQTLAICAALQSVANANSSYLAKLASVAKDACRDCAAECKKHADHHRQCKDCMESCEACARQCEKFAA